MRRRSMKKNSWGKGSELRMSDCKGGNIIRYNNQKTIEPKGVVYVRWHCAFCLKLRRSKIAPIAGSSVDRKAGEGSLNYCILSAPSSN